MAPERSHLQLRREYVKLSVFGRSNDAAVTAERLHELAVESYDAGYPDLSRRCLRRAAELADNAAPVYIDLGALYYEQGAYKEAREAFRRALDAEAGSRDALQGLAMSNHQLEAYEEATYYYLAILARDPDDFESRLNLGLIYHAQSRLDDAVEQLRRVCDLAKDADADEQAYAHLALARALYDHAEFEEAERSLRQAIDLNPQDGESYRYVGMTQEALGRLEDAVASYERAVDLNPGDADAHLQLGDLLATQRSGPGAVEHGEIALRLYAADGSKEDQARAYWTIGWGHYVNDDWEKSVAASRAGLELDPTLTPVRFNLGLALLRAGHEDEARRVYEDAVAGSVDIWDLDVHGIHDLDQALSVEPELPSATDIRERLWAKRAELTAVVGEAASEPSAASVVEL